MPVAQLGRKLQGDRPNPRLAATVHQERLDEPGTPTAQRLDGVGVGHVVCNSLDDGL